MWPPSLAGASLCMCFCLPVPMSTRWTRCATLPWTGLFCRRKTVAARCLRLQGEPTGIFFLRHVVYHCLSLTLSLSVAYVVQLFVDFSLSNFSLFTFSLSLFRLSSSLLDHQLPAAPQKRVLPPQTAHRSGSQHGGSSCWCAAAWAAGGQRSEKIAMIKVWPSRGRSQ